MRGNVTTVKLLGCEGIRSSSGLAAPGLNLEFRFSSLLCQL